jgi:hypothetical protein
VVAAAARERNRGRNDIREDGGSGGKTGIVEAAFFSVVAAGVLQPTLNGTFQLRPGARSENTIRAK